MKDLFPGYHRLTSNDFSTLWSDATFIFDTNVLLGLYGYPDDLRNLFISVLEKLESRIWVPYHVCLEFHRNRFSKIKQSRKVVEDLISLIGDSGNKIFDAINKVELEKRNLGLSDLGGRLEALKKAHSDLLDVVRIAHRKLPGISLDDSIAGSISALFEGRIGDPFESQSALDAVLAEAEKRYEEEIPPGFLDAAQKGDSEFRDRGIVFKRKYGDLIIWMQICAHVRASGIKNVVFVTGDQKADWWWIESGCTLGPRPELAAEIRTAGATLFWMYSVDQFLEHAGKPLQIVEVTPEAVDQVREISRMDSVAEASPDTLNSARVVSSSEYDHILRRPGEVHFSEPDVFRGFNPENETSASDVYRAVRAWISSRHFGDEIEETDGFPDFLISTIEGRIGYELMYFKTANHAHFVPRIIQALAKAAQHRKSRTLDVFSVVLVLGLNALDSFFSTPSLPRQMNHIAQRLKRYSCQSVVIGFVLDGKFNIAHSVFPQDGVDFELEEGS